MAHVVATLAPVPTGTVSVVVDGDDVLVQRLLAGDDDALRDVFDRYGAFVLGLARRVCASATVAEDVTQEVFTSLWRAPDRYDASRGTLRAYLGVLTYNRAVDAVRRDTRRRAREDNCLALAVAAGARTDTEDAVALAGVVRDAIDHLPHEQRLAVELVFWQGLTHREVATFLAIPEGTAKSRLRLAQAKLATLLAPLRGEPV